MFYLKLGLTGYTVQDQICVPECGLNHILSTINILYLLLSKRFETLYLAQQHTTIKLLKQWVLRTDSCMQRFCLTKALQTFHCIIEMY